MRVILGDDLRKPACKRNQYLLSLRFMTDTHVELIALNISQFHSYRTRPRFIIVDVADTVGSQVCVAVLVVRNFKLAKEIRLSILPHMMPGRDGATYPSYSPTLSWTNSKTSSGSKDGLNAVVRSIRLRDIRQVHGV